MKNFSLLLLFACAGLNAQNGLSTYAMPANYASYQVNNKNAIVADNAGNLWIAFSQVGLGKFDGSSWTMFDMSNTPFSSDKVIALAVQNGTTIWAATQNGITASGGLYAYNGSSWTDYSTNVSSLVHAICVDNSGNVWVGTQNGLYKYNGAAWTSFTTAGGLASDTVLSLAAEAASGNMLAGTARGLSVQNGSGWTNYTSLSSGFPSNAIKAVYSDAVNGTWLSAGGKVGRFSAPYFQLIDSILPTPVLAYANGDLSIARGPHGGVIFNGTHGGLIEVNANHPEFYYYPGTIWPVSFFAYNSSDGKTWIVNQVGALQNENLYAFDGNYVHHPGEGVNGLTPYNCRYLDVNQVRAGIVNPLNIDGYAVPKNGGAHTVFAAALWIAGFDPANVLHESAMTYQAYQPGVTDFFPGPLDTVSGTADSLSAAQYNYVWQIQKLKVQEFQYNWSIGAVQNGSYTPDADLLSWPAQGSGNFTRNMAPFIDVDGNGVYNPLTGGDYPDIKGDEMLYCIYNDNLAVHTETGAAPLKVEVHASAYEYYCPSIADSQKVLNYTTYYHYEIYNRSNLTYNHTFLGLFQDVDLGAYDDDYAGCISGDNFSFVANGDPNDGAGPVAVNGTYGAHPPISSTAVLDGPLAEPGDGIDNDNDGSTDEPGEKNLMSGFISYNNDFSNTGNPEYADDFYLYMNQQWKDSTYLTYGGNGYGGTTPVRFMYDGLVYDTAAWTEASANNLPFDRRGLISCGPFNLAAGQHVNFDYATLFSRDTTVGPPDTLYYDQAVNDVRRVRNWYNANSTPSCMQWNVGIHEPATVTDELLLYPNPASALLTIAYKTGSKNARYEVIDLTGRVIAGNEILSGGQTTLSVEDLPAGIYLVRIIAEGRSTAKKFIKQ